MHVVFGQCGNSINVSDKMPGTKLGLDVFFFFSFFFFFGQQCSLLKREICFILVLEYVLGYFCMFAEGS